MMKYSPFTLLMEESQYIQWNNMKYLVYTILLLPQFIQGQIQMTLNKNVLTESQYWPLGYVTCNDFTEIVDVVSPTGQIWMDRNLGANRIATAYNDAEAYGDLFQWGRFAEGHQCRWSETISTNATTATPSLNNSWDKKFIPESNSPFDWLTPQDDNLWQGTNGINNPCPSGYRLPTASEWQLEDNNFSPNNRDGAFASVLKLPSAGRRDRDGPLEDVGSIGYYWSSSVNSINVNILFFNSTIASVPTSGRSFGCSVRCIKDIPQDYRPNTVHCADTAVVNTVISETGRVWMDRNLGAAQVATAYNDANSYGDLYQWGRFAEGHQCRNSGLTTQLATTADVNSGDAWYGKFITNSTFPYDWLTVQNDELWNFEEYKNNPCPPNFRIPTEAEWQAELSTWSSLDYNGAFGSKLKLPAAGYRSHSSGSLFQVGSYGYYWSSLVSNSTARSLYFYSSNANLLSDNRARGNSVRCIQKLQPSYPKNTVFCDNVKTEIVDVISPTGKVWMDRNLGAKRVAQSSTDADAYGDLYQWGRFSDGHQCRNSATTSTNATTAEPLLGNSWDGKFITEGVSPYDWLVPQDDNLWQGVNGKNNPCPQGYRLPTESEWQAEDNTFSPNNSAGAFASPLKLPAAGFRALISGALGNVGSLGRYWSNSVSGSDARGLGFGSSGAGLDSNYRAYGFSVRCIKN